MKKGQRVWFWIDDIESVYHYDILGGDINLILYPQPRFDPIAKIRTYNGYDIHLPSERLYNTKEDCIIALRDAKLNTIL
jgi:hypothetical protein